MQVGENQFLGGDLSEIIPESALPFTRIKLVPDEEEEELHTILTMQAWVVDVPEPRLLTTLLNWLKRTGLETPNLGHLKRIRRQGELFTLLLCISPSPPDLPSDIELLNPYMLPVPRTAALTPTSLALKSSLWPTVFAPRRKGELESWCRGKVIWAWDAVEIVIQEAVRARAEGELPIAAYIPSSYGEGHQPSVSFTAHDTRKSTAHPLRHAVMNIVRSIADHRASKSPLASSSDITSSDPVTNNDAEGALNGNNYILTSMTLFITHEPCIMCSMALLHSRVKEVVYLIPMEKTGGCGGLTCIPKLGGVNHRFGICRWNRDMLDLEVLTVDSELDT